METLEKEIKKIIVNDMKLDYEDNNTFLYYYLWDKDRSITHIEDTGTFESLHIRDIFYEEIPNNEGSTRDIIVIFQEGTQYSDLEGE